MSKLRELQEKRARAFAQVDEMRKQFDGKEMTAEQRSNWDKLISDVEAIDNEIKAEERYIALEKAKVEERKVVEPTQKEKEQAEVRAFAKLLMGAEMTSEERAMLVTEKRDTISGMASTYLVPTTLANYIEKALGGAQGMLSAATILNTSNGGTLTIPTVNDTTSAATIVAEYNQSSKATKTITSVQLGAYTFRTPIIPVSYELLQDSQFDLVSFLGGLLSDSFANGFNKMFTVGTGTSQPKGIMVAGNAVNAAAATAITVEDVLGLMKSVPTSYQPNAKFMMNFATQVELMKLKDGAGAYIWSPGTSGISPTIFGHEIVLNDAVADIATKNAVMAYGDLSKYMIRNVKSVSISVLREALAEYLSVGIMGYSRADGKLIDAGTHPVAVLKMA